MTRSNSTGAVQRAHSSPRVQWGTSTGSVQTLSQPASAMVRRAQATALSMPGDPARRGPTVSQSSASVR